MEPEFKLNQHVLVDLEDKKPSPPGAFIVSDGFGCMVRNCAFVPQSKPPKIKIAAANEGFQPQIPEEGNFVIIGRVIAKLQWL